ncbi:hypothetical protein JCM10914A_42410 [Paenibacillus sp. JCM 10914]
MLPSYALTSDVINKQGRKRGVGGRKRCTMKNEQARDWYEIFIPLHALSVYIRQSWDCNEVSMPSSHQ